MSPHAQWAFGNHYSIILELNGVQPWKRKSAIANAEWNSDDFQGIRAERNRPLASLKDSLTCFLKRADNLCLAAPASFRQNQKDAEFADQ